MGRRPISALALALATSLAPAQAPLVGPDNAIGVWPWLVGNVNPSIPSIVATTSQTGLDTLYVHLYRTSGPSGGTLYMADEAGTWNPAWGSTVSWLTLSNLIAAAHAENLQVIGVVNCFLSPAPLPGDPVHEERLRGVVDYLVHSAHPGGAPVYALDGIVLDRVRYYGGTNSPAPVTAFVASVKSVLKMIPLSGFLIASPYYIDGSTYNGNFLSYATSMSLLRTQYGQDWEALAIHLDALLPMAYVAEGGVYGSNLSLMRAYLAKVSEFGRTAVTIGGFPTRHVRPAIRAWTDSTGTATWGSIDACAQGSLQGGGDGFMAFRYFTAAPHPDWFAAMSAHSIPLPNRPLAALASTVNGLTVTLDASAVSDRDEPSNSLQVRFDRDGDGIPDTAFTTTKTDTALAPGPGVRWPAVEVKDSTGLRGVRVRRVVVPNALYATGASVSASSGGAISFPLTAGPAAAGKLYLLAGSASGTSPGLPLSPTVTVPLVPDAFTQAALALANGPVFQNFVGTFGPTGTTTAALVAPPGLIPPFSVGTTLHFAAIGLDLAAGAPLFASNAVAVTVVP